MSQPVNVKVSKRYQIAVPRVARERLKIQRGNRLLVNIQDGLLIFLPQPENYVTRLAGLHRDVWEGVNTTAYLHEERDAWDASPND